MNYNDIQLSFPRALSYHGTYKVYSVDRLGRGMLIIAMLEYHVVVHVHQYSTTYVIIQVAVSIVRVRLFGVLGRPLIPSPPHPPRPALFVLLMLR